MEGAVGGVTGSVSSETIVVCGGVGGGVVYCRNRIEERVGSGCRKEVKIGFRRLVVRCILVREHDALANADNMV
jgi:hypothetical protein